MLDADEINDIVRRRDGDRRLRRRRFGDLAVERRASRCAVQDDGYPGEGAVAILRGSAGGITSDGNRLLHEGVPRHPGRPGGRRTVGSALAAGTSTAMAATTSRSGPKFDDVGRRDAGGFRDGAVRRRVGPSVRSRRSGGPRRRRACRARRATPIEFGTSLAIADYGRTDRAGSRHRRPRRPDRRRRGGPGASPCSSAAARGLTTTGVQRWSQASPGVPGVARAVRQLRGVAEPLSRARRGLRGGCGARRGAGPPSRAGTCCARCRSRRPGTSTGCRARGPDRRRRPAPRAPRPRSPQT